MSTSNRIKCTVCHVPKRLFQIFWDADLEATKLALALSSLAWVVLLLIPVTIVPSTTYTILRVIAPEWLWALTFLLQGVTLFYALVAKESNVWLFLLGPVLGVFLWTATSVAMLFSFFAPLGLPSSLITMVCSWWVLVRWLGDYSNV